MKKKILTLLSFLVIFSACSQEEEEIITTPIIPISDITFSDKATGLVVDAHAKVILGNENLEGKIPALGYSLTIDNNNIYHLKDLVNDGKFDTLYIPMKIIDSLEIIDGSVDVYRELGKRPVFANTLKVGMKGETEYVRFNNCQTNSPINNLILYYYRGDIVNNTCAMNGGYVDLPNHMKVFNYSTTNNSNSDFSINVDSIYVFNANETIPTYSYSATKYVTGNINSKPFNIYDYSCLLEGGEEVRPVVIDTEIQPIITEVTIGECVVFPVN